MITQTELLSIPSEREQKKRVITHMIERLDNKEWLETARKAARFFCHQNLGFKKYGVEYSVTSDDVRQSLSIQKAPAWMRLNNRMGGIFLDGKFERVGYYKSQAAGRRSSVIAVWKLKKDYL